MTLLAGCPPVPPPAPGGHGSLRRDLESGRVRTIVAFGDSVTAGWGAHEGWPARVERTLREVFPGVKVINAGCCGDSAADGLARLESDVLERRPDLVLVAFGLNDMKQGVPLEEFRRGVEKLVAGVRGCGSRVALLTTTHLVIGGTYMTGMDPEPYNGVIRAVAAATGVILVDVYGRTAGRNLQENYVDLVHPNDAGHALVARVVAGELLR